ncbi:MAG: hypothetical protein AAB116_27305 [Candidatus Poribacteria bacterium]
MSSGNRFGFSKGTVPIPNPKPIQTPITIQNPIAINAPMPLPEPFIVPSTTVVNFTFEEGNMIGWTAVDELPSALNDIGPSKWSVVDGPISGKALLQNSIIWGDKLNATPLGTSLIYDLQEWNDLNMEFDMFTNSQYRNGFGIVWGWKAKNAHYRFMTILDPANPTGAPPEQRAPLSMIQRRIRDEPPYYFTMVFKKEAAYIHNIIIRYRLEIRGQNFKVYWNNVLIIEANALMYQGGKVGFTLYGQNNIYFDNIKIESVLPDITNQMDRFIST